MTRVRQGFVTANGDDYDAAVVDDRDKLRSRLRLAFCAERALGVDAMPNVHRQAEAPEPPAPATDLFGNPLTSTSSAPATTEWISSPVLSTDEKRARLSALELNEVRNCTKCRLCAQRTNTVFGEGDPDAQIMFVGEGPGENEDLQGRPFVGRAGELLNKWIAAMGLKRQQVYIGNIVKCRPPTNREPAPDEVATCTAFLVRQIEIIRPQVIVTLGRPATEFLLQQRIRITQERGQWRTWRGTKLMPTYHPAYVLRNYSYETRAAVWADLQNVMKELGLPMPSRAARG